MIADALLLANHGCSILLKNTL